MKKGDIWVLLIAFLLITASVIGLFIAPADGEMVIVKQNNQTLYSGSLDTDRVINLSTNTVVISDGFVFVQEATCKNQLCVHHKKISEKGESIVCLPNKVTVQIE